MDNQSLLTYNGDEAIVVYQSEDNTLRLDVQMAQDTVWLTQQQIALLFDKAKSTISYHISNVFTEGELDEKVVVRKIRIPTPHGAIEGKTQYDEVNFYNLDVIISVGYRVKSKRGVLFRQWATKVLREYLFRGYAFVKSIHDRFLIIDDKEIYLIGASLKDLGRKLFAFSKMEPQQIAVLKSYLAKA